MTPVTLDIKYVNVRNLDKMPLEVKQYAATCRPLGVLAIGSKTHNVRELDMAAKKVCQSLAGIELDPYIADDYFLFSNLLFEHSTITD